MSRINVTEGSCTALEGLSTRSQSLLVCSHCSSFPRPQEGSFLLYDAAHLHPRSRGPAQLPPHAVQNLAVAQTDGQEEILGSEFEDVRETDLARHKPQSILLYSTLLYLLSRGACFFF